MANIWNNTTVFPEIGSTIVAKMVAGADREYQIYEITNGTIQQSVVNDPEVEGWAYIGTFTDAQAPTSGKLLSGIKEGTENDWAPTVDGYVQEEHDIYMLRQQINGRIQTLPNEVDNFSGIDYWNIIFGNTSVEQKAAVLIDVIQNIPTVKEVVFVNASWIDKPNGVFQFIFQIQSVFGDLQFQMGLDAQNRKILTENAH